jgi:hypothetical protein
VYCYMLLHCLFILHYTEELSVRAAWQPWYQEINSKTDTGPAMGYTPTILSSAVSH